MKIQHIILTVLALLTLSCRTPKENVYFADAQNLQATAMTEQEFIKIKPGDRITVIVSTGKHEFDNLFNASYNSQSIGRATSAPNVNYTSLYIVDSDGDITLPVLGDVQVAGLTRTDVARKVEQELLDKGYAQNAVAIVEFEKYTTTILGEVKSPGRYTLGRDGVTIIEALGVAGDLTVNANRNNIKVVRDEGTQKRTYVIDLNSIESTVGSPAYYLQQNDIIYVEPNEKRIRQSVAGGNELYSTSFWLKLSSLLTSVASLIIYW